MDLNELRDFKRYLGYSNKMLAEKSGVPLGTVQKVLGGITKCPRKRTVEALSSVFSEGVRGQDQGVYVHWREVQKSLYRK